MAQSCHLQPDVLDIIGAHRVTSHYVAGMGINFAAAKVTTIKSCIGTGKTTFIKQTIADLLSNVPVTIVCHRVGLVEQWVGDLAGLGFIAYNDPVLKNVRSLMAVPRLIISYDSLHLLAGGIASTKGLLVLDEADQGFEYLLLCKETSITDHRNVCWDVLKMIVQRRECVIATSATIAQTEVNLLAYLSAFNGVAATCQHYINEQLPFKKKFIKVASEAAAVSTVARLLSEGKKVYVCSDSASKVEVYERELRALHPDLRIGGIWASNKGKFDLTDINATVVNFDCLIASPTLGTGTDINNSHFDAVVGIFTNEDDLTYKDCLQACGRVRYPNSGEVYVYLDDAYRWRETDPGLLADRYDVTSLAVAPWIGERRLNADQTGWVLTTHSDIETIIHYQQVMLARAARGKVARYNKFWLSVAADSHDIADDVATPPLVTSKQLKETAKDVKTDKAIATAEAATLSNEQVEGLQKKAKRNQSLTETEQQAMSKHFISRGIYPEADGLAEVTPDEVLWYEKTGRKSVALLRTLVMDPETAMKADKATATQHLQDGGYDAKYLVRTQQHLTQLLSALAPIIAAGKFVAADLDGFMAEVNAIGVEEVRKLGVKVDLKSPAVTASSLLALLEWSVDSKYHRVSASATGPASSVSSLGKSQKMVDQSQRTRCYYLSRNEWQTKLVQSYATPETAALLGVQVPAQ